MKSLRALWILLTCGSLPLLAQENPAWPVLKPATSSDPLPGTAALTETGDLSRMLHEANDRFLDREIERAAKEREKFWKRDLSSPEAYAKSVQPNRERLAKMLGIDREARTAPEGGNQLEVRGLLDLFSFPDTTPRTFAGESFRKRRGRRNPDPSERPSEGRYRPPPRSRPIPSLLLGGRRARQCRMPRSRPPPDRPWTDGAPTQPS
jgi:hypothetical protein